MNSDTRFIFGFLRDLARWGTRTEVPVEGRFCLDSQTLLYPWHAKRLGLLLQQTTTGL